MTPSTDAGQRANVDPDEIARFEELAARWWDPESEFKPLHRINPLRSRWIDERSPVAGKRLLDVGCGGGLLCEAMAVRGASVVGIDMGEAPLTVARLHARSQALDIDYRHVTAEDLAAAEPGAFDVVTCLELLEHVPRPEDVVEACARLVRRGGNLYFSTINRNPKSWLFAIVGAEYVLGLLPRGTHRYANLIRPSELDRWCRRAGLAVVELTGLHYNPVSGHYRLGPGVDVNYMVHARTA